MVCTLRNSGRIRRRCARRLRAGARSWRAAMASSRAQTSRALPPRRMARSDAWPQWPQRPGGCAATKGHNATAARRHAASTRARRRHCRAKRWPPACRRHVLAPRQRADDTAPHRVTRPFFAPPIRRPHVPLYTVDHGSPELMSHTTRHSERTMVRSGLGLLLVGCLWLGVAATGQHTGPLCRRRATSAVERCRARSDGKCLQMGQLARGINGPSELTARRLNTVYIFIVCTGSHNVRMSSVDTPCPNGHLPPTSSRDVLILLRGVGKPPGYAALL